MPGEVYPDANLYFWLLPRTLKIEDPYKYYQPSSPWSPDFPNADHTGDQHPWSIGFTDTDFRKYRPMICRFPNEGGCLGPVSLPTTLACLPEGPMRKIHSFAWQQHDNSIAWNGEPPPSDKQVAQYFGVNVDAGMAIEDFVYWGGMVQSEAYKDYIESFRGKMFDSASAIFWMYNDTWPVTRSWTIVDYCLRRTPSFWSVRRANAPVHIILAEDPDGGATVWGVNDTPDEFSGSVRFGVFGLSGGYGMDESVKVKLAPSARTKLGKIPGAAWSDPVRNAAFAWLSNESGKEIARTRLFRPLPKDMQGWREPKVSVRVENGEAVFKSDAFVAGVCIDLNGETALADNFFDLFPGREHRIAWPFEKPPVLFTPARKGLYGAGV
jgi:beta-mannosidase